MRPEEYNRMHFACDGSIELVRKLDASHVRVSDTASGRDPQTNGICLWRCVRVEVHGSEWECIGPWTEQGADDLIRSADALCVVPAGE